MEIVWFDLLGLPRHLLELIFDMLMVLDRIRLNMALPRRDVIVKTSFTCTQTDRKLVTMQRYFKKRFESGQPILYKDLKGPMIGLIGSRVLDPTVAELFENAPQLAIGFKQRIFSTNLVNLIKRKDKLCDINMYVVEGGGQFCTDDVTHALETHGTPAMYAAIVKSNNPFQEALQTYWQSFVFGVVCNKNESGLLSHIMQQSPYIADMTRNYLASMSVLQWFVTDPQKLKQVVEHVGVTTPVLHALLDVASSRLIMHSVKYIQLTLRARLSILDDRE